MGLLDELMGGGERQERYQDFVGRYDEGAPYEGISDQEALDRHDEMAQEMSPEDYRQSAHEAFSQMAPEDRRQFGQDLAQRAQDQGIEAPGLDQASDGDPEVLAQLAGHLQGQSPGLLGQLMGSGGDPGGGGGLGSLLGGGSKGALAGIAAQAARRFLG